MTNEQLQKGLWLKDGISYTEREAKKWKKLRDHIVSDYNEKRIIEEAWSEFHMFDENNTWAVSLRAKFIKAILETIDERLASLDVDLIELQKEFDKICETIFMPMSLIRHKKNKTLHIVEGNYTLMYGSFNGGCNFEDISVYDLDESGKITNSHSWENADEYELVDETRPREMYEKVLAYLRNLYCHPFTLQ